MHLFELLNRKGFGADTGALAVAINFRLEALARLLADDRLRGWSMPGTKPGMDFIHADLIKAAADEPVIEDAAGQAAFDAENFRRRVLANAGTRGQA